MPTATANKATKAGAEAMDRRLAASLAAKAGPTAEHPHPSLEAGQVRKDTCHKGMSILRASSASAAKAPATAHKVAALQ